MDDGGSGKIVYRQWSIVLERTLWFHLDFGLVFARKNSLVHYDVL